MKPNGDPPKAPESKPGSKPAVRDPEGMTMKINSKDFHVWKQFGGHEEKAAADKGVA